VVSRRETTYSTRVYLWRDEKRNTLQHFSLRENGGEREDFTLLPRIIKIKLSPGYVSEIELFRPFGPSSGVTVNT
jgi:hypothetical protein